MITSLVQALGLDSTFFVQFFLFTGFYPVLSYFLLRPYILLQTKREHGTKGLKQNAFNCQNKTAALKEEYEHKQALWHKEFNQNYKAGRGRQNEFWHHKTKQVHADLKQKLHSDFAELDQEIKHASDQLSGDQAALSEQLFHRLISKD